MKDLLVILGILVLCFELYRLLRGNWIRCFLKKKKEVKQLCNTRVMKPKSERDCPFCINEKGEHASSMPEMPIAWRLRKGRGGPTKKISTQGFFCPNPDCEYFSITDESIHALVGYGSHGKQEPIEDLKCQACGRKFTSRKNTILYRLKTHSELVEKIMWLLALGVDASAIEEVFSVREITIRTWLCRGGMQGKKLHERFMLELDLIHVQLDELWANVKSSGQDMWLWVGVRTQEIANRVVHELKGRLRTGCVPVLSTDGAEKLLLLINCPFWKVGIVGWQEADLGLIERLRLGSGHQAPKKASNHRRGTEDFVLERARLSPALEGCRFKRENQLFIRGANQFNDPAMCV